MNDQIPRPPDEGKFVREVPEHPVVRDSEDNPVVRKLDLEQAIRPLDTRMKVGFAVIGAIGVANLLGVKAAATDGQVTTTAAEIVRGIVHLI